MKLFLLRLLVLPLLLLLTAGCATRRPQIPAGEIPQQADVPLSEEQYGHEVLNKLSEQYPLDRDDGRINRARDIVARLTGRTNQNNVWHVYVLVGDDVQNAAATRGNYIFLWTGILKTVKDDSELATVLAHEIAHVLAGHTQPTPTEEASAILAEVAGTAAREVVFSQGAEGALAGLAGVLVQQAVQALVINPESQRKELEADTIGLFLMADSGYDPDKAVDFWSRMQQAPGFSGMPVQFLSSHPSSEERLANLRQHLPQARERFQRAKGDSFTAPDPARAVAPPPRRSVTRNGQEVWVVMEEYAPVYDRPSDGGVMLVELPRGSEVTVKNIEGRWLSVTTPVIGYSRSIKYAPMQ